MDTDLLIYDGAALKLTSEGANGPLRLEGYLIVFSDENTPDLDGEFFTKSTDFGPLSERGEHVVSAYYHHGLDPTIGRERLGTAQLKTDDVGVWAEYQLTKRKEYLLRLMEQEAKAGRPVLGQSSGAVAHTVSRVKHAKATHLTSWDIGEASPTPTPAEPRTSAVALKSLLASLPTDEAEASAVLKALRDYRRELTITHALRTARSGLATA